MTESGHSFLPRTPLGAVREFSFVPPRPPLLVQGFRLSARDPSSSVGFLFLAGDRSFGAGASGYGRGRLVASS